MIERSDFDWGVQLEVRPFAGVADLASLKMVAEIMYPRPSRGREVRISFSGVSATNALNVVQAQTWTSALNTLLIEAHEISQKLKKPRGR